MQGILAILIVIISQNGIKPFTVKDFPSSNNSINIYDFNWPADAASIEKIPKHNIFYIFFDAIVDILPYNFTEPFEKCKLIQFVGGSVKSIHINHKLDYIYLYETSTENVIIKPDMFYKLGDFSCTKSKLTQIPENINRLKHLKILNLQGNLIETVQMDQLNGLDNLRKLKLSVNKIKHIYSDGPVSLPSLSKMDLGDNRLQHFDVCSWDMPALVRLDISGNNLKHFAINQFRALGTLRIGQNPLNCEWKNNVLEKTFSFDYDYDIDCDENSIGDFELDCPLTNHQLKQQISSVETRIIKQVSDLSYRMQKIEDLLQNLTAKIIMQENVSNDIIEAMYRIEIERASNHAKKIPYLSK